MTAEGNIRHIVAAGKTDMLFPAIFDPKAAAAKTAAKVNTASVENDPPEVQSLGFVKQ